jgi:UDP-N-acetylglucosamine enolpyruvyl transferase
MLAATLAEGRTVIRPAAQEPEVDDLIVPPDGRGRADRPRTIEIEGRKRLRGAGTGSSLTGSRPAFRVAVAG